jgi:hypothetical protein
MGLRGRRSFTANCCHAPRRRGIQHAAASQFNFDTSGILDHPHSRVMTFGVMGQRFPNASTCRPRRRRTMANSSTVSKASETVVAVAAP